MAVILLLGLPQACAINDACHKHADNGCDLSFKKQSAPGNPRYVANTSHAVDMAQSIDLAYQFLYKQMDKLHQAIIIYDEPNFSHYYPSGFMGDSKALSIDTHWQLNPQSGLTSLRIHYDPHRQNVKQWAGIYFQYPDCNWGDKKGRDLSGARTLRFWVKADRNIDVEFVSGGINIVEKNPVLAQQDSYGPIKKRISVTPHWVEHTIDLAGQDLSNVIGPFALVLEADKATNGITLYLDNITVDHATLDEPRFIQSYEPIAHPTRGPPNISHVYDQSLVLLAFLARGTEEDLRRAQLIADAMILVQNRQFSTDSGALRNAYASGEVLDYHTGIPRVPGWWNNHSQTYCQDNFALGNDTGNNAWAGIALIQLHHVLNQSRAVEQMDNRYLAAAEKIAQWIVKYQYTEGNYKGYIGGLEVTKQMPDQAHQKASSGWQSSEHNIDLVALFEHLSATYRTIDPNKSQDWKTHANHARQFIQEMWHHENKEPVYLLTGANKQRTAKTEKPIPLDVQTWAVLALDPNEYRAALDWALLNCHDKENVNGFDFNCDDGDGSWWEGTGQMVTALNWLKRHEKANAILDDLRKAQIIDDEPRGAFPAANKTALTTGFEKEWGPWVYTNEPHIGATAWYLFAALKKNPYYIVNPLK